MYQSRRSIVCQYHPEWMNTCVQTWRGMSMCAPILLPYSVLSSFMMTSGYLVCDYHSNRYVAWLFFALNLSVSPPTVTVSLRSTMTLATSSLWLLFVSHFIFPVLTTTGGHDMWIARLLSYSSKLYWNRIEQITWYIWYSNKVSDNHQVIFISEPAAAACSLAKYHS